jgi:uncharacterized membrane protein
MLKKSFKEDRPKLDLPVTVTDRMIESAGWSALLILWGLTIFFWSRLPETIPTHFNMKGEADGWGSKLFIFFMPALAIVITVTISLVQRKPHAFNYLVKITPENAARQYLLAVRMLRFLKFSISLIFIILTSAIYLSAVSGNGKTAFLAIPAVFVFTFVPMVIYFVASLMRN